jgi:hypothetical protein
LELLKDLFEDQERYKLLIQIMTEGKNYIYIGVEQCKSKSRTWVQHPKPKSRHEALFWWHKTGFKVPLTSDDVKSDLTLELYELWRD